MSCTVCNKETSKKCSGCQSVFYCSLEHQRENWKDHKQRCSSVMVLEEDPVFGIQWIASRDLEPGTLLLNEDPVLKCIYWPPDSYRDLYNSAAICLTCGMNIDLACNFYKCSTCSWPVCNQNCENNSLHKDNECQVFKEAEFSYPPTTEFINPTRIDLSVDLIRAAKLKLNNRKKFKMLMNLQHEPSLPQSEEEDARQEEDAFTMKCNFDFLVKEVTDEETINIPWIRKINGFRCDNAIDWSEIHCIYLKASRFSNSCSPNCVNSVQPQPPAYKMQIRTAVSVKKGEPLTIAYAAHHQAGTADRQKELRDFHFICKCKRCLDPTECGTYLSAVTCSPCYEETKGEDNMPADTNEGFYLPEDPLSLDENALWKCNRCFKVRDYSTFAPTLDRLQKVVTEEPLQNAEFYNRIIDENMGNVVHKNHFIILKAIAQMTQCFVKHGEMDIDLHRLHLHHELAIINHIFPGLSFFRARQLRNLATILHGLALRSVTEDLIEEMSGFLEGIMEAITYYSFYKHEVLDGESSLKGLAETKMFILSYANNK